MVSSAHILVFGSTSNGSGNPFFRFTLTDKSSYVLDELLNSIFPKICLTRLAPDGAFAAVVQSAKF